MKNLTRKLCEVMGEITEIEKTGYNSHQNYAYVTEAELMKHIRPLLTKKGVFIFKSIEEMHREDNLTSIKAKYTFVDSESGESFEVSGYGQGADKQDKGYGKADTNAYKYFLLKNFLISTHDDPENESKNASSSNNKGKPAPKRPPTKAASKKPAPTKPNSSFGGSSGGFGGSGTNPKPTSSFGGSGGGFGGSGSDPKPKVEPRTNPFGGEPTAEPEETEIEIPSNFEDGPF